MSQKNQLEPMVAWWRGGNLIIGTLLGLFGMLVAAELFGDWIARFLRFFGLVLVAVLLCSCAQPHGASMTPQEQAAYKRIARQHTQGTTEALRSSSPF